MFRLISEAADRLGLECYVVGGYVRDIFLERPSNDIDVVVVGSGIAVAEELKRMLGSKAHLSVFKNFGTAMLRYHGTEVEFVGARKESYQRDSRKPIVEDGTLEEMNSAPTYGTNPVHLVVSPNGKNLYVGNLETGCITRMALEKDGSLGSVQQVVFVPGQEAHGYISHPHQVCLHPDGKWLLVPCQGRDHGIGKVEVYAIDPVDNALEEAFVWTARKGAEPRHVAIHPNGKWVYLVNEKDSTAIFFHFDEETGHLEPQQIMSTLPDDYFGPGWASGMVMGPEGKCVYASNRTQDSVTVFAIDPVTGRLSYRQNIATEGKQPRFIDVESGGETLVARLKR